MGMWLVDRLERDITVAEMPLPKYLTRFGRRASPKSYSQTSTLKFLFWGIL